MNATTTSSDTLQDSIARCRKAQAEWEKLTVKQRLKATAEFRRILVRDADQLCAAVERDLGKSGEEVLGGEILPTADACRFLQKCASHLLKPRRLSGWSVPLWLWGQSDTVYRKPRGLIGLIGTWNYPVFLNAVPMMHALTAGNGIVWKPSETAPETAKALFDLLRRSGYPDNLIHMMPATREAGKELADSDIDHVLFTGSSHTGRLLAGHLGSRLISSTLELSGCDAMFVLDDADAAFAARAAWFAATVNRGQTCLAVRRAFVHRSRYDAFTTALRGLAEGAAPMRLALVGQVEQAHRLVGDALAGGASLLTPAPIRMEGQPEMFAPTVVMNARPEMGLCREASFAPLLAVILFDSPEEALEMDRHCAYGLGSSIFTGTPKKAVGLALQLRTGSTIINDTIISTAHPSTPFGGRGVSGWGVTQGEEGLLEMTVPQVLSVRGGTYRPHYDLKPEKLAAQGNVIRGLLEMGHADTLGKRIRGAVKMVKAFIRGG